VVLGLAHSRVMSSNTTAAMDSSVFHFAALSRLEMVYPFR
jgi:hypothetical protein